MPINVLKTLKENEKIKYQELNLLDLDAIPAGVNTVMIVGPQYDFSDREMKLLRHFWDKQGRILLLLDPASKTPKLRGFLNELGVKVNDDRLMVFLRTGIEELALTRDVQARFLGDSADQRVQMNSPRLVVVSNATFVQDNAITQDQQALDFISGSVNWLLSREQLIGIAPKISKPLTFSLSEEALRRLRWIFLVFMPLVPAVIGTMVWWQRRV